MATPYFQQRHDTVPSTQNLARNSLVDLPVLVLATSQTEGRGRTGSDWQNAERALAASLAAAERRSQAFEDHCRKFTTQVAALGGKADVIAYPS